MLELEGIHAGYGSTPVLSDVDLVVPPGSIVAMLGPNGAGKTTLLRVASGLLAPSRGSLRFEGEDITGLSAHERSRRGLALVPEGRGIFRSLSVRENLVMQASGSAREEALELAAAAFPILGRRLAQQAGTLSGGEQQMLSLARVYVSHPRVVLLDEVSLGLAPRIVEDIFDFLGRLATEGTSLLLVEQYVTRALALADFTFILQRGSIVFAGEASEVDPEDVHRTYLGADTDRHHDQTVCS